MVPIKEMTDILRVVKTTYGIKKGSWIRIKHGSYRDYLANIEHCDMKAIVIFNRIVLFKINCFFYNLLAINKTKTLKNDVLSFAPGDQVEVCEDELINLQGTIFGIDGDSIRILAKHEASKDEIAFKENIFLLMSVRISDLQIYTETATGVDSTGQFQLKDLVNISADKVGVVICIEKECLHRLNMDGKVQVLSIQSITKRKTNRNAAVLDSQNNNLNVGDMVTVIDGPFASRQGQIKHLYRHFVFIFCRTLAENGDIFVRKARNLLLAGGQSKVSSNPINTVPMSPLHITSPSPHTS
ncbi:unnamed protein product [Rotaria sordida]|uniref:KOW domain-containing protein n=1 Tax=Rotaria sordida TaxID=392033 RepID=A0A814J1H4_9BILA|nr:unnamed protein product [Rotaria sordida]CAF1492586.1 unnamed protein product [Rotaria sordida]